MRKKKLAHRLTELEHHLLKRYEKLIDLIGIFSEQIDGLEEKMSKFLPQELRKGLDFHERLTSLEAHVAEMTEDLTENSLLR